MYFLSWTLNSNVLSSYLIPSSPPPPPLPRSQCENNNSDNVISSFFFPGHYSLVNTSCFNLCSLLSCPTLLFSLPPQGSSPSHPSSSSFFIILLSFSLWQTGLLFIFFFHTNHDGLESLNGGVTSWLIFPLLLQNMFLYPLNTKTFFWWWNV